MQHKLEIIPIPAFKDNYIWLAHNATQAFVVDPGDADPVLHVLSKRKLNLTQILITHHHSDHIDGVATLIEHFPETKVYAPKLEKYAFKHVQVSEPDVVNLDVFDLKLAVLDLPGHTLGHVAYYANGLVFCGDTLFGAGCGRLFEGTPQQMYHSLQKLAALPADTAVYCTHEYTSHNIRFGLTLDPHNQALLKRQQLTYVLRQSNQPSLPSTIQLELDTNPFLRCHLPEIRQSSMADDASPIAVFAKIREMRNHY